MGVFLEAREIEAANKYMESVKRILNAVPDARFTVCQKCRGTGITSKQGDQFWDGRFCEECKGYSIKIEKAGTFSKCTKCNGIGRIFASSCPKCEGYGYLDWLENITGIRNKK